MIIYYGFAGDLPDYKCVLVYICYHYVLGFGQDQMLRDQNEEKAAHTTYPRNTGSERIGTDLQFQGQQTNRINLWNQK